MAPALETLLLEARRRREPLRRALLLEGTDCYRLFHGAVEGRPGLTLDRYGDVLLLQSFREPLERGELEQVRGLSRRPVFYNHRGRGGWQDARPEAGEEHIGRELGVRFALRFRHRGQDPWLFLDFRAGRRWIRGCAAGARVLNLFAYTCGVGLAAMAGGAAEVWNVDFARSALAAGRRSAQLNGVDERFKTIRADVIPTVRQLAGLPIKGRGARRPYARFQPRRFDRIVLDPPTWARSPFGAVDPVRDYAGLFKPCLLALAPGGKILATNHVAGVDRDDWLEQLRRCAEKAGRPLSGLEVLLPEADFPSPDGRPPLKMAIATA